jgi:hypothetical protein
MTKNDVSPDITTIPNELTQRKQWVLWCYEPDPNGRMTKVPYQISGYKASTTNPKDWSLYNDIVAIRDRTGARNEHGTPYAGIGFVFNKDYVGTDWDHCKNEDGSIEEWAREDIDLLATYCEDSPSGTGIHGIARALLPERAGKNGKVTRPGKKVRVSGKNHPDAAIEMYCEGRFFTMTGKHLEGTPITIEDRQEEVDAVYQKMLQLSAKPTPQPKQAIKTPTHPVSLTDQELIEKACSASNGEKFSALWYGDTSAYANDASSADQALCNMLAFWTNTDAARMDSLFRQSGLYRAAKWDRNARSGETYGEGTIRMAIAQCIETYGSSRQPKIGPWTNTAPYAPEPQPSSNGNGNGHVPPQREPSQTPDNQRAGIIINNAQLRDVTRESMAALHALPATNDRLFVHFSQLSRVVRNEDDRPIVQQMNIAAIKGDLSTAADFYRIRKDQKTDETVLTAVSPTNEIAEQILALPPSDWRCPSLKGITEVPLVKPDGTLLDTPGYDKKLKVFYDPSEDLKDLHIPEECTQEDAVKSAETLKHLIAEFPFEGEADIANMLGLFITPFIRYAFKGDIQLALLDATNPGTGKTYLAQLAAILATGTQTEARSQKADDDEWRKFILAVLLKCPQMVLIDNVRGTLAAVSLEAALTSETISDRLLGVSKDVSATNTAVWMVTGNNLLIGGDLSRRCFRIRLIATDANPDERDNYEISDILNYCQEHRKEYVVAILTMIKAWFQAEKPAPSVRISKADSFGPWIKMVGGILDFAGVQGWQQNRDELRSKNNEEAKEWEQFLNAWTECYGETWKKTIDVQKDVINGSPYGAIEDEKATMLFEAVPAVLAEKFVRNKDGFYLALAKALKFRKQTVFGLRGFQIESQEDSHTKNLVWRVTTKKTPGNGPENDPQNKSENKPPQTIQSINKSDKDTSGSSHSTKNVAVDCGGPTPLPYARKNNSLESTTVAHNIYSPGSQGVQTTAIHRNPENDSCEKVPSEQATSGVNGISDEGQKTPICGGSFQNSESRIDFQGISEEHIALFIEYVGVVRSSEKPVLFWDAPGRDCKKSPFGKDGHIARTHSLLRSGDASKVGDALAAMQCTVEKYSVLVEKQ